MIPQVQSLYGQLVAAGVIGLAWPVVQAAFDKVEWTATKRRAVALAAGAGLSVALWYAGGHQEQVASLLATAGVVVGAIQTGFTALKELGVLDWVGQVTPGGEPSPRKYEPRHAASTTSDEDAPAPATEGFDLDEDGNIDVMSGVTPENMEVFDNPADGEEPISVPAPDQELVEIVHARRDAWTEAHGDEA